MRWFRRKPQPTYTPLEMVTVTLLGGPMDGRQVEVPVGARQFEVPYLMDGWAAIGYGSQQPQFGRYTYRQMPVFEFVKEGGEGVDG